MIRKMIALALSALFIAGCSSAPNDPADNLQNFQDALKLAFNKSVERIEAADYLFTKETSLDIVRNSLSKDNSLISIVQLDLEFESCPFTFDILSTQEDYGTPIPLYLLSGGDNPEATIAAIAGLTSKGTKSRWIVQKNVLHVVTNAYEDVNVITIAMTSNGEIAYHSIRVSKDDYDTTVDNTLNNKFDRMAPISTVSYIYGDAQNAETFRMSEVLTFTKDWWLENYTRLAKLNTYDVTSLKIDTDTTPVLTSEGEVLLAKEKDGAFSFYTLQNERYVYNGENVICKAKM